MNTTRLFAAGLLLVALGAGGGYWAGQQRPASNASSSMAGTDQATPKNDRPVLYWHDPMVPGQRFDKPGKSPFMDMELVPVYADDAGDASGVRIDPRLQQNLGVRLAEVVQQGLAPKVETVGVIAYNERAVEVVTARASGFIDKLYVRAPLDPVRAGQPLAELLAPEWVAAQEEYLALARSQAPDAETLRRAARQRLTVLGMPEGVIRAVEREGKPQARVVLTAPISGVVGELSAREGMTALQGAPLFRINGLGTVWINAEVPETQAALVRSGHPVRARVAAYPGQVFAGQVATLLPEVDPATRTLKARIEVANPKGLLKPGMFASVDLSAAASQPVALLVPTEAVIRTGTRNVVIVALEGGKFRPVDVVPGIESDGMTEIRQGLQSGQKVVASGQFLIDSEASLKATVARMGGTPAAAPGGAMHHAEGVIEAIGTDSVTLSHDPVTSLDWPAMTMGFKLPAAGLPAGLQVGDHVSFAFSATEQGEFAISSMTRAAPQKGAAK